MTGPSTGSGYISGGSMSPKSQQEMAEKLKSLKRRFDELEEECGSDGNRLNERNVRMREEPGQANSFANLESIVRVAEAAVAAQNAAKLAATPSSQQNTSADPNLDPSLFAESSNPSPKPEVPNSATTANANNAPALDTASINNKLNGGTSPTSTTSTSSLSNNPYLALATNYQRGGTTSPTGHPMLFPHPIFYPAPGASVTPGTPKAYPVPYNPYYYIPPHMVGPNGMYAPSPGFAPSPQAQPTPTQQVPQQKTPPQTDQQRGVKPKRLKSHTVTTKSFSIPMVPRDRKGNPMLPLNVGIMTVISLGTVCMRDHFHTERYIFPVGYEVTRRYLSTLDPNIEVVYHCTILDGGDGPKFQIIPSDRPDKPVIAGTATGAWSSIVKQANAIRNRQHSNSVSGPDFFGLGQNTIKHLIQELPNADKLRDYVWQNFVEGGPLGGRHAAVIPALPEEYDASLPIGAYYPRRNEVADPGLPRGLSYYPQHIIAQAEAQRVSKAAQPGQAEVTAAGPSGTGSISATLATSNGSQLLGSPAVGATPQQRTVSGGNRLVIQEYQPPPLPQVHSISAPSAAQAFQEVLPQTQKRITRSSTAANANATASTSANTSVTSARHTKSASKGQHNQRQPQQQKPPKQVPVPVVHPTMLMEQPR